MTKNDIIRMARQSGLQPYYDEQETAIQAFASLVAAHKAEVALAEAYRCGYEAGVVAEREACAKVCEEYDTENDVTATWLNIVANAIRERGTT